MRAGLCKSRSDPPSIFSSRGTPWACHQESVPRLPCTSDAAVLQAFLRLLIRDYDSNFFNTGPPRVRPAAATSPLPKACARASGAEGAESTGILAPKLERILVAGTGFEL